MSILMILFGQSKPTLGENWATYSSIYNDFFGTEIVKLLDLDSIVKKDNFIYVNTSGSLVRKRTEKNRVNCRKKTIQFVAKSPYVQSQSPPYKRVKKGSGVTKLLTPTTGIQAATKGQENKLRLLT